MVTWTFDLFALIVGFLIGMFVGALLYCTIEQRSGGAWSKGFYDGCDFQDNILPRLKQQKKDEHESRSNGYQPINKTAEPSNPPTSGSNIIKP